MEDIRTLLATNELQWVNLIYRPPYRPWHRAHFRNIGLTAVKIAITYPDRWFTLKLGEDKVVEEKINIFFYRSFPGLNATLEVMGVY